MKRWFWDYFSIFFIYHVLYKHDFKAKGNLQLKTKWMIFDTYSSAIHDEWVVSSLCNVIGVHYVPCFISDLNSSRDLPKLIWEFPVGGSPTK